MDFIDEETAALILQLQVKDSNELTDTLLGKGKGREGTISDAQYALQLYQEELERTSSILTDRLMTKSIAQACKTDGGILSTFLAQEQAAASDRDIALGLNAIRDVSNSAGEEIDVLADEVESCYETDSDIGESSLWVASRRKTAHFKTRKCTACREEILFYNTARAPCGHEYSRDCLRDLFSASLTDESLFPPRCCRQHIAAGPIRIFLTSDMVKQYEAKKIEYDTTDRTYCSNPICSAFVLKENIRGEEAICGSCATSTCTVCKGAAHLGDCPSDTALQLVLQTADENGWQRCYNCRRLVELDVGCNYMTCPCGAQFCYICGQRWKTCQCAQWNEDRLYSRAQQVVARRPALAGNQQHQQRVETVVHNLRNRHNYDHERWQYVGGQHQCEECYHTLPSYIFECRQCNIQACNRCRKNRL